MNKMIMMSGVMFMSVSMSAFGMEQNNSKKSVGNAFKEVWNGFCHCIEILTIGVPDDDDQGSVSKEHSIVLPIKSPKHHEELNQNLASAVIAAAQSDARRTEASGIPKNSSTDPQIDHVSSTSTIESQTGPNALVSGSSRGEIFASDTLPKNSSWVDVTQEDFAQHQKS